MSSNSSERVLNISRQRFNDPLFLVFFLYGIVWRQVDLATYDINETNSVLFQCELIGLESRLFCHVVKSCSFRPVQDFVGETLIFDFKIRVSNILAGPRR